MKALLVALLLFITPAATAHVETLKNGSRVGYVSGNLAMLVDFGTTKCWSKGGVVYCGADTEYSGGISGIVAVTILECSNGHGMVWILDKETHAVLAYTTWERTAAKTLLPSAAAVDTCAAGLRWMQSNTPATPPPSKGYM